MTSRAPEYKPVTTLTGKGGVALVMYHLARLGVPFEPTSHNSDSGDIWARLPDGRIVSIEVKTSTRSWSWAIKRKQLQAVDYYILVDLYDTNVWVFAREQILALGSAKNGAQYAFAISKRTIPNAAKNAWNVLGLAERTIGRPSLSYRPTQMLPKKHHRRVVRHRLKSGEIKEYVYPSTA